MTTAGVRLWTVEEYHRLTEAGILDAEERVELLEGQILQMAAKNPPHSATNLCAANVLTQRLAGLALVRIQDPIILNPISEPEPDIAVVRLNTRFYQDRHPVAEEVFLILEIADTTLKRDRQQKAPAYARANISDYWVLDVNTRQIYVFRQPESGKYQEETLLSETDILSPLAFPEVEIQAEQLFP